jgi:peptidoglycan/LPS O-acetylase OafA/YrhL
MPLATEVRVVGLLVFVLTVLCNLMLLAAMAAGRSNGGWGQRLLLVGQVSLMAAAVVVAIVIPLASGVNYRYGAKLVALLGLLFALAVAGSLTYLEYLAVGQRQSFGKDLRRSRWVGRHGAARLDDPDD